MPESNGRIGVCALFVCLAVGLSACGRSPSSEFLRLQEAARAGDAETFASGFVADSQPFARALLALYSSQYPAGSPAPRPLDQLTVAEVRSESIEGDKAEVIVAVPAGAPAILVFIRESGSWKLDVRLTDRHIRNRPIDDE